jgi:hypothetical protein
MIQTGTMIMGLCNNMEEISTLVLFSSDGGNGEGSSSGGEPSGAPNGGPAGNLEGPCNPAG